MPNYRFYSDGTSTGTDDGSVSHTLSDYIPRDIIQKMWEKYEQRQEEKRQLQEDKKKYPLFFWKENI